MVDQDWHELVRLSMVRPEDKIIGGLRDGHPEQKYQFCHGFMQELLRAQMLSSQLDTLFHHVTNFREKQSKMKRQQFMEKAQSALTQHPYHHHHQPMIASASFTSSSSSSSLSIQSSDATEAAVSAIDSNSCICFKPLAVLRLHTGMVRAVISRDDSCIRICSILIFFLFSRCM